MHPQTPPNDPLYPFALALLELIEKPVLVELEHHHRNPSLAVAGTLIRAFDPPNPTAPPSITIMIGAHTTTIRLAPVRRAHCQKSPPPRRRVLALHALLTDGYALHIKPSKGISDPPTPAQPE